MCLSIIFLSLFSLFMVNDIFGYDIETTTLTNNVLAFKDKHIATSGQNIYITYINRPLTKDCADTPTPDLYLIKSNDSGKTFSSPQIISDCLNTSGPGGNAGFYLKTHDIVAEGSNVYVVYKESPRDDRIEVRASHDNGNTFTNPIDLLDLEGLGNGGCTLFCTNLDIACKG